MILCDFFVVGDPVAQPRLRPRASRSGRLGVYMPPSAEGWRQRVTLAGTAAWNRPALTDALDVDLCFFFVRPGGHFTARGALKASAPTYPTTKPDRDNVEKSTADALNGIIWRDDAQLVDGRISKRYVNASQPAPGCRVTVRSVP